MSIYLQSSSSSPDCWKGGSRGYFEDGWGETGVENEADQHCGRRKNLSIHIFLQEGGGREVATMNSWERDRLLLSPSACPLRQAVPTPSEPFGHAHPMSRYLSSWYCSGQMENKSHFVPLLPSPSSPSSLDFSSFFKSLRFPSCHACRKDGALRIDLLNLSCTPYTDFALLG
ncbi:hypothetical protein IE53DRAFT_275993 [Violaceomyces palustris]|uniref:Uncharacterized protein n=1 Tax=Violaceomyces palustris TaxID=1673888 RepID=A0ACD0P804_9BASI|nr:hypothetical protein IE53DRAFT_275993 [Violaceomyces palustris]